MSGSAEDQVWRAVEALYRREARLLQAGRYEDWVALFAPDIRYRAPVVRVADTRADVVGGDRDLAYYDEDRETLLLRARKLVHKMAWTEYPPSRLRYLFQVLEIEQRPDGGAVATSNFVVYQTRLDDREHVFFGARVDRLRLDDGGWRVAERRVELDRSRLASENLSVFF